MRERERCYNPNPLTIFCLPFKSAPHAVIFFKVCGGGYKKLINHPGSVLHSSFSKKAVPNTLVKDTVVETLVLAGLRKEITAFRVKFFADTGTQA